MPLQFSCQNFSQAYWSEFKETYSEEGWIMRKVIALPEAMHSAFIKTIYHSALAIFFLLEKDSPKINSSVRDFEEFLGWFITIGNDRLGQYFVYRSAMYKQYYLENKAHFTIEKERNFR